MKRLIVPLLVAALAIGAFMYRDRWLPEPPGNGNLLGYVEGETILVGAPQAGRLVSVMAEEGTEVKAGVALFALDPAQAEAELARAEAAVATAKATHRNLLTGKRDAELAVIDAQISQTRAALDLAEKDFRRADMLASSGTAARARLDTASEQVTSLQAKLAELRASEAVARLPARDSEIAAAASRIAEAEAAAVLARRKLADLTPAAPKAAKIEDVFFAAGEWVGAGQPVVSLLAGDDLRLRFFVPEAQLAAAAPGARVTFHCDGCGEARIATITKVASQPEFTPPVIYSEGARAKLVWLVEARPERIDSSLRPGLPIEVEPLK